MLYFVSSFFFFFFFSKSNFKKVKLKDVKREKCPLIMIIPFNLVLISALNHLCP